MNSIRDTLREWLSHHITTRNQIRADIIEMAQNTDGWDYYLKTKRGDQTYLVMPTIDIQEIAKRVSPDAHVIIITSNSPSSLQATINGWDALTRLRRLSIFFVNPYATHEKHWALHPAAHDMLIGRTNLAARLKTLFESVAPYTT
ncbi:hypothetical protein HY641_00655 [Candidatus Woesearchaeota archaeon]|nr:hypothetical protein [Candidatus Woesearchaeota archaeon]